MIYVEAGRTMIKKMINVSAAILMLIIFSPFALIYVIILKLFYKQKVIMKYKRIGKNMRPIQLYRFYPLDYNDSKPHEEGRKNGHPYKKLFERLVLITNIDSWPLLINLLRGELNLVGPIPETEDTIRQFKENQKQVFAVRPGLWGKHYFYFSFYLHDHLHSPNKNDLDKPKDTIFIDKINRELDYVNDIRIGKDILILIKTFLSFFRLYIINNLESDIKNYNYLIPVDMSLIFLSYFLAYQLRFEWHLPKIEYEFLLITLPILELIRIFIYNKFGLYKNIWKYVGLPDLVKIIWTTSISSILFVFVIFFFSSRRRHTR